MILFFVFPSDSNKSQIKEKPPSQLCSCLNGMGAGKKVGCKKMHGEEK
jgi:hypothetical protein